MPTKDSISLINSFGTKSITLDQYPAEAWDFLSGAPDGGDITNIKSMWGFVPWLYSGINIISQSCAEVPVALYKGNKAITSNEDWTAPAAVGYIPDISKLIRRLSASITLEGQGYLFRDRAATISAIKDLVFWNPTTVKVDWEKVKKTNELSFLRTINGKTTAYTTNEVIYFWPDDGYTEVGPPASSPARAALAAAGVLHNADKFIAAYWSHGAVRAMMLALKGNPPQPEKDKLLNWWKSVTGGVKKAFDVFTINAESVTPTMIGDGLDGLQNTSLTTEKREDISTALGIPQSILFSTNAGGLGGAGVADGDRIKFYEMTVIPLAKLICSTLNNQQLIETGYRLVVNENEMAMYQPDENLRTQSVGEMVKALADPEKFLISADIIGMEIDEEQRTKIEAMIADKNAKPAPAQVVIPPQATNQGTDTLQNTPADNVPVDNTPKSLTYQDNLDRWRRKALKAGGSCDFVSDDIPDEVHALIMEQLAEAKTPDEIKAAFVFDVGSIKTEDVKAEIKVPEPDRALLTLADSIREAVKAIGAEPVVQPQPSYTFNMPPIHLTTQMPAQGDVIVNIPEQPAPNVTIEPAVVNVAAPNVTNEVTVQPAKVIIPDAPKSATIEVDPRTGKRTLKVD